MDGGRHRERGEAGREREKERSERETEREKERDRGSESERGGRERKREGREEQRERDRERVRESVRVSERDRESEGRGMELFFYKFNICIVCMRGMKYLQQNPKPRTAIMTGRAQQNFRLIVVLAQNINKPVSFAQVFIVFLSAHKNSSHFNKHK